VAYLRRSEVLPWVGGGSILLAGIIGIWAIISPESVGWNGLILLAGIAVLLFVLFYGLATGTLTVGKAHSEAVASAQSRMADAGLFMAVLDETPEAYLIVSRAGAVIYANRAYEDLTMAGNRGRNAGRPLPLEQVFAGDEELAPPLYRLARGARQGDVVSETLKLKTVTGDVRHIRASVHPVEGVRDYALYRLAEMSPGRDGAAVEVAFEGEIGQERTSQLAGATELSEDSAGRFGSLEDLSGVFEQAPLGLIILDRNGSILRLNQAASSLLDQPETIGQEFASFFADEDAVSLRERLGAEVPAKSQLEATLKGDEGGSVDLYLSPFEGPLEDGHDAAMIAYVIDTTERLSLEMQMAQSQKMQAVGQLAGGVAHDFNNLLTAIIGFCDLLLARHQVGDPSFGDIDQIRQNANRAANLVRQLLAFSRQQTLTPKVFSPTDILTELSMLLRRLLGEKVELDMSHGRNLGMIKVDQSQLDTALINLAVNARDAMQEGGRLTIATSAVSIDESDPAADDKITPGKYVLIEVRDTGTGIPEDVLSKIFEPFFTTKGVGEGTGLGLSTVYGIIKQMGGFIYCDSEVDVGTTFRIYLPVHEETAAEREERIAEPVQVAPKDLTGMGTILLVEDEEAVRAFATRALSSRGYTVLEAGNGVEALEIFKNHDEPIDLMVSDVVMPEMDGPTLANEARALKPETKIIFISGYAEDAFKGTERPEEIAFLPKPFSLKQLAAKVKEVLSE